MSKRTEFNELRFLRAARKRKQLRVYGGLYLSEQLSDEIKREFCAGCGKRKYEVVEYFGETFCRDCVNKWQSGRK